MKFKYWLENEDNDDWTPEEIEQNAQSGTANLTPPFNPPEYCDPDDFYQGHGGGLFTFTYSQREVKNPDTQQPEPEGLRLSSWADTHRNMANKNYSTSKLPILCGRYGVKNGTPIVAFWDATKRYLLLPCLKELLQRNLVRQDAYVYSNGDNAGTVAKILKIRQAPAAKKAEMVQIGSKQYSLYEIPALLHSLPAGSDEHRQIAAYICQTQHPYLQQFKQRAKCGGTPNLSKSSTPDFLNRRSYWGTSESCHHPIP